MKKIYLTLILAALVSTYAMAQVSIDEVATTTEKSFENDMKTEAVEADYVSVAFEFILAYF